MNIKICIYKSGCCLEDESERLPLSSSKRLIVCELLSIKVVAMHRQSE